MKIGIIGGSGLYNIEGLENAQDIRVDTPFGQPSDNLVSGRLSGIEAVFLARHGRGHRLMPSEINHKANIYAMKKTGVEKIISVSAVGSFKEELAPRDVVFVDQFVDRTRRSLEQTFFGDGVVAHVGLAEPVCPHMRKNLLHIAQQISARTAETDSSVTMHDGGTYLNMEGPCFSTKAESLLYKSWGLDVIGMTNMPEARLAREAELCYTTMAMVTDYDCWHEEHDSVSVEAIINNLNKNAELAKNIIREALPVIAKDDNEDSCDCRQALKNAVITDPACIPKETYQKLELLLSKYIPKDE